MTDAPLLSAMFSFVSVFYGLLVPLLIVLSFALLFIPSMLYPGSKPYEVGSALFHYCMQGLGILLMTVGALPTITSVLAGIELTGATYFTLLLVFAAGGILFLWHDNAVRVLDTASRAVPGAIFLYTVKSIGYLIIVLWSLSVLSIIVGRSADTGWWIQPLVMLVYGTLLTLCAHSEPTDTHISVFKSISMNPKRSASTSKKPVRKSTTPKKRKR